MSDLREWITVPRDLTKITAPVWGNFVSRWNGYMYDIRNCIEDLDTRLTTVEDIPTEAAWDPAPSGLTFSTEEGSYRKDGSWIVAVYRGTVSGVDGLGTFINFTLPEAMDGVVVGDILSWGEAVYQDVNTVYVGKPRVNSTTVVGVRPQAGDGIGNGAWRTDAPMQPVALFSVGDVLSFTIIYKTP